MSNEFKHIGLQVNEKDLIPFYQGIFRFEFESNFVLSEVDANKIFDIKKSVSIIYAKSKFGDFELFIADHFPLSSFTHFCVAVEDPLLLVHVANEKGYEVVVREKEGRSDTYFIRDSNRNVFEVKKII